MRFALPAKIAIGLCGLLLLADCATNPVTGQSNFVMMSESQEIDTGRKADAEVKQEYGVYDLPRLQRYVNEVGQKLAKHSHRPQLEYHFTVVDSPEINAFALPGGYVYITRGILAYLNSEAELAAVLGHEIGHVTARHSVQQYTAAMTAQIGASIVGALVPGLGSQAGQNVLGLLGNALLSGYGREHELEADRLGAEYLARTGYDPQAMIRVLGVLKNQELFDEEIAKKEGREPNHYHGVFASHPDNDTRLQQVIGEAQKYAQAGKYEGRNEFYRHINGIVYGDSPHQGIVRGRDFQHGELGFAIEFPENWRIQNRPDKIVAMNPSQDAGIEFTLAGKPQGSPADFLRKNFRTGFGADLVSTSINGLPAAILTMSGGSQPLKAAAIYLNDKAYVLVGGAKSSSAFNRAQSDLSATIGSFRALSEAERKNLKALTVTTVTAKAGMTYSGLARQSPLGKYAEGYLRLMNSAYPSGEPSPGQTVKIVE